MSDVETRVAALEAAIVQLTNKLLQLEDETSMYRTIERRHREKHGFLKSDVPAPAAALSESQLVEPKPKRARKPKAAPAEPKPKRGRRKG